MADQQSLPKSKPPIPRWIVPTLLLLHAVLLAYGDCCNSPAIDEVGHMAAGLSHWKLGRFDLYQVNPPLVRMVAVVPVLFAELKLDWACYSDEPGARSEFELGRQFITNNGARSFWFFTWARWACIPFSLLGAIICYWWAYELYGPWSGLLALILWCFEPNILANGQMITPDMGATALGVTAAYCFWKWLKEPTWQVALLAGLALGAAELAKTTWILLFCLWPLLWFLWRATQFRRQAMRTWLTQSGQLGLILSVALYLMNAGYGFQGSLIPLGDHQFVSETLAGSSGNSPRPLGNRFAKSWLGKVPVPLPRNYLLGIDVQKSDFEAHFPSYLCGEWRNEGWWYYYLVALGIKVPLGIWILALLAAVLGLVRPGYMLSWRDEMVVIAPGLIVFLFVSSQTGFNHHGRYVLPIFPFLLIWLSKVARIVDRKEWGVKALVEGATAWAVVSSLLVFPHSLSYFNELVGGPANGSVYFVDSNIDWGQDLFYLRDWLTKHPEARPLKFAYFGNLDPRIAGIEFNLPPKGIISPQDPVGPKGPEKGPVPGWFAISATLMRGASYPIPNGHGGRSWVPLQSFSYFQRFRPVTYAGWSIFIYHIDPRECARVRREMGLPEIPEAKVP